jgi:glutaconyl-CoA decarboxylase
MPGTVLKVLCSAGQAVKAGDTLFILEAMKMENEITAECDGVVKQILVGNSTVVNTDDVLAII